MNAPVVDPCWNRIGVWGDSTCPELVSAVHCRNCPVYAAAGRSLLEREAPTGYVGEWTSILARHKEAEAAATVSVVAFRLGSECLALPTHVCKQITEVRSIHRIPHRSNEILTGLANIGGEIQLCVLLRKLLELDEEGEASAHPADGGTSFVTGSRPSGPMPVDRRAADGPTVYKRMVVVESDGERWVFPVDEMLGIFRLTPEELAGVPATVTKAASTYTRGVFRRQDRQIACLDEQLLFAALKRCIR